jgi:O-antigen ligase
MRAPSKVEQVYVVAALCTLSAIAFIVGDQPCCGEESLNPINSLLNTSSAGDTKKQMILLIMYSVGFLFMLRLRFRIFLFLGLPLLSLIIWCFVSAVWSVDPSLSFRRCIALGGTVGLGLYLGLQCSLEKFMSLMRWVVGIIILASFIVAAALPIAGLDYDGRLRGVFDHKNDLGDFAGLGFVLLAGRLLSYEYKRRLGFAVDALLAALCIVALVLAQSASPIPALIVSMAVLALAHGARVAAGQITAFMPIITAATAGGILMLGQNIDFLSKLLDRSSDLSGRVRVWAFSIKMVMERPLDRRRQPRCGVLEVYSSCRAARAQWLFAADAGRRPYRFSPACSRYRYDCSPSLPFTALLPRHSDPLVAELYRLRSGHAGCRTGDMVRQLTCHRADRICCR